MNIKQYNVIPIRRLLPWAVSQCEICSSLKPPLLLTCHAFFQLHTCSMRWSHSSLVCFYMPILRATCSLCCNKKLCTVGRRLETLADQHFKFTFHGPLLLSLHISVVELLHVFKCKMLKTIKNHRF